MNHKRGGHPVPSKTECSLNHVGDGYTDCVPQTMFELGYLNEASARHLVTQVGCHGVRYPVITDILNAKYEGCTHYFTPRGLSYKDLKQYLPSGMSTLGGYNIRGESDPYGTWHAVTVFHSRGKIGYMDGQCNKTKYETHEFTRKELETLTLAYAVGKPTRIHEITPQMIDAILETDRARRAAMTAKAEANAKYTASVTEALRKVHERQSARPARLSGWAQAAQLSKAEASARPARLSGWAQAAQLSNAHRRQNKESEAEARRASRRTTAYDPMPRPSDPRTRKRTVQNKI